LLMHFKGQVLIFLVDPIVGYDGPDKFTDQPLRIGVRVTDPKGRIGIFLARVGMHGPGLLTRFQEAMAWAI
jgi:hypothetical protein